MIINQACSSRKRSDAKNWLWISRHRMIFICTPIYIWSNCHIYMQELYHCPLFFVFRNLTIRIEIFFFKSTFFHSETKLIYRIQHCSKPLFFLMLYRPIKKIGENSPIEYGLEF